MRLGTAPSRSDSAQGGALGWLGAGREGWKGRRIVREDPFLFSSKEQLLGTVRIQLANAFTDAAHEYSFHTEEREGS